MQSFKFSVKPLVPFAKNHCALAIKIHSASITDFCMVRKTEANFKKNVTIAY